MEKAIGVAIATVLFGAALGFVAAAVTVPFAVAAGPVLGGICGLLVCPLVVACLRRKRSEPALLLVFVPTVFVTLAALFTGLPFFIMGASLATLCLASIGVWLFLADAPPVGPAGSSGGCRSCGYDLTGNVSGRCPECGRARSGGGETAPPAATKGRTETARGAMTLFLGAVVAGVGGYSVCRANSMRPAGTVEGLIRQLADPEILVHGPALDALVGLGPEALRKAMGDSNPVVRGHAVRGMGRQGDPVLLADLVRAICDADGWVRQEAIAALGALDGSSAVCAVLRARPTSSGESRLQIDQALRSLGEEPGTDASAFGCPEPDP